MNSPIVISSCTALIICLALSAATARAQTAEDKSFLSMYFSEEEIVVQSATRSPQPLSQVAENMTVVTAAEIERMNAHTLADVLNTVPGVEVWLMGGPGQQAQATILGSNDRHVIVIMDGVVLNYLWSGIAELGMIPVQNIEKIEIIKGPASSAWGSALGGVVNIITKSGRSVDLGGLFSGSYGNKSFSDFRAEARGKQDRFGYYLTAGRLQSDGLTPRTSVSANNVYAKMSYDLTDKTDVLFALAYERSWREDYYNYYSPYPWAESGGDRSSRVHSTVAVNSALTNKLDLNVSVWTIDQYQNNSTTDLTTGDTSYFKELNQGYGATAKLIWKPELQTVVLGVDIDDRRDTMYVLPGGEQTVRKWAVYANDTILLNRLSVTPGIRLDHTSSNGDVTSPSLGLTYTIGKNTIIRASAAHGFSIPKTGDTFGAVGGWVGNPDLKMETVWSYQAGVESAALKYVWMKFSMFRNDIRNEIGSVALVPSGDIQNQNIGRGRREGVVIEAKTAPVFGTTLSAGAEFVTAKDLNTGEHIIGVPVQVYDMGVTYDDKDSFKAQLQGRHIKWNSDAESKYHSMLLDLTMIKKVHQHKDSLVEVFVSAHNLLNTTQYLVALYPNPERWFEGGVRYKF